MKPYPTWAIAAALAAASVTTFAAPLPDATSLIGVAAANRGDRFTQSLGPQAGSSTLTLNWGDSVPDYPWQIAAWHSTGAVTADVGQTGSQIGWVSANAQAQALGYRGEAHASAGGQVQFAFRLSEIAPLPPGSDALWIPVKLTAQGSGEWTGDGWSTNSRMGGFGASVDLQADDYSLLTPFPLQDFRIARDTSETTPISESFSRSVTLGMRAASLSNPDRLYLITSTAGCGVTTFGSHEGQAPEGTPLSASASCRANVDPVLSFDQAAFDADPGKYGATQSFNLAEHYALEYSPNIPAVPEPANRLLMVAGLVVVGNTAMRRLSKRLTQTLA